MMWLRMAVLTLFLGISTGWGAHSKDVLVVLSSESQITLKDGKTHPTGFFLTELMGPLQVLMEAGYKPVFANPKGNPAVLDKVSDSAFWFGNKQEEYLKARRLCESLGICGAVGEVRGTRSLLTLSEVRARGLEGFAGVFFPGGHAPMEDLWKDADVGAILRYFHSVKRPTALICHAPIALLAALDNPKGYIDAKIRDDRAAMVALTKNWIYRDYALTVFSTREEQQEETGGADGVLGGFVRFYPDETLEKAGAYVRRADKWQSQVVIQGELITGQNPFSHGAFGEALLNALNRVALP